MQLQAKWPAQSSRPVPLLALQSQELERELVWEAPFNLDSATMFCEQNHVRVESLPCWLSGDSMGIREKRKGLQGPRGGAEEHIFPFARNSNHSLKLKPEPFMVPVQVSCPASPSDQRPEVTLSTQEAV